MRTLEFYDISRYLPYELTCLNEDGKLRYISGISLGEPGYDLELFDDDGKIESSLLAKILPLLHPIDDLTKEIIVPSYNDGRSFVPILHLAKVAFPNNEWTIDDKGLVESNTGAWFWFHAGSFACDGFIHNCVPTQVKLFEMLNKWHFDYLQLIDENLCIDINTIKL